MSQNHPFIDGNKRVGFAVAYTFLFVNGYLITADAGASFAFIDGLYSGRSFACASLEGWLRDNTEARPDSM